MILHHDRVFGQADPMGESSPAGAIGDKGQISLEAVGRAVVYPHSLRVGTLEKSQHKCEGDHAYGADGTKTG